MGAGTGLALGAGGGLLGGMLLANAFDGDGHGHGYDGSHLGLSASSCAGAGAPTAPAYSCRHLCRECIVQIHCRERIIIKDF